MKSFFFISNILLSIYCNAQDFTYIDAYREKYDRVNDSTLKFQLIYDTTLQATYNTYRNYVKIFKNDILLEEGYRSWCCIDCACKGKEWTTYYSSGRIKSKGDYHKYQKINDWNYYFDNGNISKLERYFYDFDGYSYYGVKSMIFAEYEYYENGQLKMEGQYEKSYDCIDSIYMVDPETGKDTLQIMAGTTCSKKCGTWNYYSPDGTFIKKEE